MLRESYIRYQNALLKVKLYALFALWLFISMFVFRAHGSMAIMLFIASVSISLFAYRSYRKVLTAKERHNELLDNV